jgi:hypothetical protein
VEFRDPATGAARSVAIEVEADRPMTVEPPR